MRDPGGRPDPMEPDEHRSLVPEGTSSAVGGPRSAARAADRLAADRVRQELRAHGIVPIEPDERIAVMLRPDEAVVAIRRGAAVDRRQPCPDATALRGDLYVTTRRLIHLGRSRLVYDLDAVREAIVVGDDLLLAIEPDLGLTVSIDDPRQLRVLIAAARSRSRR